MFAYNDALQLDTETIDVDGGTEFDRVITRKYWEPQSIYKGKDKGFQIGTDQDPDADYDVTYHYNALVGGRY